MRKASGESEQKARAKHTQNTQARLRSPISSKVQKEITRRLEFQNLSHRGLAAVRCGMGKEKVDDDESQGT